MSRNLPRVMVDCPSCGQKFETYQSRIRAGRGKFCSKSCAGSMRSTRHGHSGHNWQSRTYISWAQMRQRCGNPKHPKYYMYGERGIKVCARWRVFENFLADMGERPKGKTLDRIDFNGDYKKENCRWATARQQARNTRHVIPIMFRGKMSYRAEIARELGIEDTTLKYRIKRGWPKWRWGEPTNRKDTIRAQRSADAPARS